MSFEKSIFIHSAEKEHRDSIIANGLRGSENPVVINGIFTFPEQWGHHETFSKRLFDQYKIKLKDNAEIFWTDSDRPLDALMGSGTAEYRKLYNEILKNTSLKSKEEVMKALTVDFQSGNEERQKKWFKWKAEFSRGIENYLKEKGYAGIQQGGEVIITNPDSIESITLNGKNIKVNSDKKTNKMENNKFVEGGNIDRALDNSNAKPEEIISNEVNFDTRKGLNRSDKVVPKEVIEEIEEKGMSLERLEELGLPIFKYQTQITVHGIFEGIGSGRVGGYKNLLSNQNQTLGVKYNAIDLEKKKIISKALRLDREFNGTENGFNSRMDSKGFQIYKRRQAKDKEEYVKVVEELKSDSEKIPSNFIGKKMVNAYKIWGMVIVELLIDFKAIKQDNLWSFISSLTDGRISDETKFNELLNKEKDKDKERHDTYEKERKEREAKEKALLNELKDKSTFPKSTEIPTSNEFIVAVLGLSYGDAVIRVYSVFKNKTGRKVYSVNNYKNWSEVPTTISDEIKNSRGNKFFDETTIKILTKYIEKGMLFDVFVQKKEVKKDYGTIYTETKTETVPSGDVVLLDDSRYQLVQSKHTKTGDTIYLFKLKQRVDRDDYKKIEANVKAIRGYYSSFVTAFVLKSAISANEAEMLLKGSVLEHKKENGGEISDDPKINEAAKNEVEKLVNETDITKEEAVKEMKEGIKVEEEHRETLEKLDKGEITVEEALAETSSVHIEEKKDYYTGGLNPMENKDKSNEELKKQLGETELQLFNKAEEKVPSVNLARTIELAENIARLENKERKDDLAFFAEALQYTVSDAENDVYARFWATDIEYMVGLTAFGFVGLERAIEVGAIEGGESFLEHIDAFKKAAETFRELTNKSHKALLQNFVKKFILGNELSTQQDYIWMAINDVYKLIYFAKNNETDTTKIAEYIGELMTKYQAQSELEKLVEKNHRVFIVHKDGSPNTEFENLSESEASELYEKYLNEPNSEIVTWDKAIYNEYNKIVSQPTIKMKVLSDGSNKKDLSEVEKIEQEVRIDFPDADDETVAYHVKSRLQAIEDNKLFETAKMQYPIVIEWSEGASEKNIGFDYLYQLNDKIKSFGVTNEPKSYYIKTKVWFRDYPHDGKTDFVTVYNGHDVSDFNPETQDVIDFLKKNYPNFDWTIYEYGDNYKFGHIPEPEFKAGDLVRITIEDDSEEKPSYRYEYGYITDKKPTYIRRSEKWKPHYIYDVVDMFDEEKTFKDVIEWRLKIRTEDEVKDEMTKEKLRLGHADLLIKEEAELLADKYIAEINRLNEEYSKHSDSKHLKQNLENAIYTEFYDWFSNVVVRYPSMLGQWLNMQVEKLPNYKEYLLNGFVDIDNGLLHLTQFFNSLNKINKGKSKPKGIYELIPENFIDDKKTKQIDFELDPSSAGLLSIMKPFFMKDDLRPVMSSINFDHRGATSTDAHRLMFLKGKSDKKGIYGFGKNAEVPIIEEGKEKFLFDKRGKYLVGKKGVKYPKYYAVIPKKYSDVISLERDTVQKIVNSLRTFKNVNYYGKYTDKCHVSLYKGEVTAYNIKYLLDLLEAWLKIGFDKLEMTNKTESLYKGMAKRTILIVSPDVKKFTNDLKGSGSILMAVMISEGGEPNRSIERGEMYVDFNTGVAETAGVTDDLFSEFNAAHNTYGAETEKNEIDELQMMIELMEDTVKESPTEENQDYLDLLKETLISLRQKNEEKFNCGGKMYYYHGGKVHSPVSYKNGGLFDESELNELEKINNINNTLFYRYYPVGVNPFEISFDESNKYGYGIYFLDNPYFYKSKFTDGRLLTIKPNVQNPFFFTELSNRTPNGEYAEALLAAMKNDNLKDRNEFTRKMVEAGYDSLVAFEPRGTYLVLFSNDPELYEVESDLSSDAIDEKVKNELSEKLDLSIENSMTKFPDLNKTESEFLYNTFSKIVQNGNQKEQPIWITSDGFKGSMKKVLLKKNYIDDFWSVFNKPMSYDRNEYSLTEKGLNFINEVQLGLFGNEMAKGGGLDKRALKELKLLGFSDEEIKWAEIFQKERDKFGDIVKIKDIPNIKSGDMLGYIYKHEDDKLGDIGSGKVIFSEQWGEWGMNAYPFNMQKREIQENKNNPEFELKDIQNHEYKWTLYHLKKTKKMDEGGNVDAIDNPRALGTALKKVFKNDYKIDIDTRYIKTVRGLDGSWYEISTFNSKHTIPNEVRKELLELSYGKPITELGVSNPNDIYYGNIRGERVSVFGKHWKEWLKTKKFDDGGEIVNIDEDVEEELIFQFASNDLYTDDFEFGFELSKELYPNIDKNDVRTVFNKWINDTGRNKPFDELKKGGKVNDSPFGNYNKESVKNIILNEGLIYAVKDYMDSDAISKSEPELRKMWDDVSNDIRYFESYNRTQGYEPAYLIGNPNKGYSIISDPKGGEYREVPISELTPFAQERMKKINNLLLKIINYIGLDVNEFGEKFNEGGEISENDLKQKLISILDTLEATDLMDFIYHIGNVESDYVDDIFEDYKSWVKGLSKDELDMVLWRMKMPYFYVFSPKDNYSIGEPVPSKFATYNDFYEKKYNEGGQIDISIFNQKTDLIGDDKQRHQMLFEEFKKKEARGRFSKEDQSKEEVIDIIKGWYKDSIQHAIDKGWYQEDVEKGRMTASDAKTIIESVGLEVPKDIFAKGGNFSSLSELKKAEIKMMDWSEMEVHYEPRGDNGLEGYDRNMIYYYKEYETDSGTGTNKKRYLITNGYNPESGKVFGEVNDISSIMFGKYFKKIEKQKEN